MKSLDKNNRSGFGLIELSIVMIVLAVIVAATLPSKTIKVTNRNVVNATANLRVINDAIAKYISVNKKLPCPASLIEANDSPNFGKAAGQEGSCNASGIYFGGTDGNIAYGMVPVKDINLKINDAKDPYNSKIVYIVDKRITSAAGFSNGFPNPTPIIKIVNNRNNKFELADYAVISYGKNAAGAFGFNSNEQNQRSELSDELDNDLFIGANPVFDYDFVENSKQRGFDDKIVYGNRIDLMKQYNIEYIIKCEQDVSEVLYGTTMTWTTDANPGQEVPSDTPCPTGYQTGPKYALKKCTKDGEWGAITEHCQAPVQCEIAKTGVISKIVFEGSGTLTCDDRAYTGTINYDCKRIGRDTKATLTMSGNCSPKPKGCYLQNIVGIDNATIDYGSGSIQCRPGFVGNVNYSCTCNMGVYFYEHCPYVGPVYGRYNVGDYTGVPSGGISGYQMDAGVTLVVYTGGSFTGGVSAWTATGNSCLTSWGWNDRIRSFRVEISGLCPDNRSAINTDVGCRLIKVPDFSDTVDSKVGFTSLLSSLEPNLKLWLDASNIDGHNNAEISSGLPISTWYDLSGNHSNALQNNPGLYPSYDGTYVDFSQHDRLYANNQVVIGAEWEFYVVYDFSSHTQHNDWNTLFRGSGEDHHLIIEYGSNNIGLYDNNGYNFVGSGLSAASYTGANLIRMSGAGSQSLLNINGLNSAILNKNVTAPIYAIGNYQGGYQGFGKIAEILVFNRNLDDKERAKVSYYLSKKWGMTDKVDSDQDGIIDRDDSDPAGTFMIPDFSTTVAETLENPAIDINSVEPNLKLWLDASNIDITMNKNINNNDKIATWSDLSGTKINVSQSNPDARPAFIANALNGKPTLRFDGVNDYLWSESLENLGDATMFAVVKIGSLGFSSSTNSGGTAVSIQQKSVDNFDSITFDERSDSYRKFMHGSSYGYRFHASSVMETQLEPVIIQDQIQNNNFRIYRDGITVSKSNRTLAAKPNTRFLIGNRHFISNTLTPVTNGYWFGDIYEVIIINRVLSDIEKGAITAYLSKKWGLTEKVDSDEDGTVDAQDDDPAGLNKYPDFSDTVDSMLNEESNLNDVEQYIKFWVDGSNIDYKKNNSLTDGEFVSTWNDLSGNELHLRAIGVPIYKANILNSKGVVDFTVDGMESINQVSMKNIFLVHKTAPRDGSCGGFIYDFRNGNGEYMWSPGGGNGWLVHKNGVNTGTSYSGANIFSNQWQINFFQANSNSLAEIYLNARYSNNELGCGQVAEMIIFDAFLTQQQIDTVERYLAKKWGLDTIVDSDADGIFDKFDTQACTEPAPAITVNGSPYALNSGDSYKLNDGSTVLIFRYNSSFDSGGQSKYNITFPNDVKADILIVGGGGGAGTPNGASYKSGGGGAGGMVYVKNQTLAKNADYIVHVGRGGTPHYSGIDSKITNSSNSIINLGNISMVGFGGGASAPQNATSKDGGSGGGGGHYIAGGAALQGLTVWDSASNSYVSGGQAGWNYPNAPGGFHAGDGGGAGGATVGDRTGRVIDITGSNVTYATGGVGTSDAAYGAAHTGNGGNGRFCGSGQCYGATGGGGGSGIIIIRYTADSMCSASYFDGVDDYIVTGNDSIDGSGPLTVAYLIKPMGDIKSSMLGYKPWTGHCNTQVWFRVLDDRSLHTGIDKFSCGGWVWGGGTGKVNWNEENLIAFKINNGNYGFYINGAETRQYFGHNDPAAANSPWTFGNGFKGYIKKIGIFSAEISKAQLDQMRNLDSWVGQNSINHYYDLEEVGLADTTVIDKVGGLNATIYGNN